MRFLVILGKNGLEIGEERAKLAKWGRSRK